MSGRFMKGGRKMGDFKTPKWFILIIRLVLIIAELLG